MCFISFEGVLFTKSFLQIVSQKPLIFDRGFFYTSSTVIEHRFPVSGFRFCKSGHLVV